MIFNYRGEIKRGILIIHTHIYNARKRASDLFRRYRSKIISRVKYRKSSFNRFAKRDTVRGSAGNHKVLLAHALIPTQRGEIMSCIGEQSGTNCACADK